MNDRHRTEAIVTRRPSLAPWSAAEPVSLPLATRWNIALERARRWEFWPAWLYYLPIIGWILWLGVKHRSWTAFTAANPAIEAGGVVGERKHQALGPLQANAPELVACFVLIDERFAPLRLSAAFDFAEKHGYPVVLKPDVGSRGRGVYIARDGQGLRDYLERFDGDVIAQRYVEGEEYGVFVARKPGETQPRVLSIVNKTFPGIVGDGKRRLRELILADARARLIASALFARWSAQLDEVPLAGERIELVEIGAHCRGSLFLDAGKLATPALVTTLTRLLDAVPGYGFGRIDLRVTSAAHLSRGEGLQVIELNGVTAESAHIYQPGTPLLTGYRAMFSQWALAFEIGQANARLGAKITGPFELLRRFRDDLKRGEHWF
ncbi:MULTISPECIES: hypothetical protein [Hydrocarboniphaga]|jgi:hypothetical protein|uniref:ATP-binding protein n=1 Tax=Hydrocarboniphaga TaxID=243627 RepID=UPI0012FB5541|nr:MULTISPECIES: hypothetical protein [Hydrocarboniphaga]MDZ4080411.1 hypothetical protein [Hydrocarboniphaga sp.]